MNINHEFTRDTNLFKGTREDNIIIIRFKYNLLRNVSDIDAKELLFDYLRQISEDDTIKLILIFGSQEKTGRDEYIQFYKQILKSGPNLDFLIRLYNAADQIVKRIAYINKMIIHADSGKINSLFMNIGLACDYRIIDHSTLFQNAYHQLGLLPKGGGAFFLPRLVGVSKASEVMLRDDDITAEEALSYGFINKIVPSGKLEEVSIQIAKEYAKKSEKTLSGVKGLLNCSLEGLDKCLEYENTELKKMIRTYSSRG